MSNPAYELAKVELGDRANRGRVSQKIEITEVFPDGIRPEN